MRSDGIGESHKCQNFGLFDCITPVGQERCCRFLAGHFSSLIEQHFQTIDCPQRRIKLNHFEMNMVFC